MNLPRFSVIMPLFNKAPYVEQAVKSVLRQSLPDWELVVVDDGSTDGGGAIVKEMNDPRVRLIEQVNSGVAAARNRGVAATSAPYLCFLDADDWWEPTFLEEMAALVERHPNAGLYSSGYYLVKHGQKRVAPIGVDEGFTEGEIDYCKVYAQGLCMPVWTGAVCIPREVFVEQGGFRKDIALGEDFLLWIHAALQHPVVLMAQPLSNYNQDADPAFRAISRLHPPERHMLWHLHDLEPLEHSNGEYKRLVDALRCYSLKDYLLDRRYTAAARRELAKVDWNLQPIKVRLHYRMPVWVLHLWRMLFRCGAYLKRWVIEKMPPSDAM